MTGSGTPEFDRRGGPPVATLVEHTRRLAASGDATAVVMLDERGFENGYSYAELSDLAFRIAGGLSDAGIGADDRVALFAGNSPEWVAACLGVICAGAVVIPLDAELFGEDLSRRIRESACRAVLAGPAQSKRLRDGGLDKDVDVYVLGDDDSLPSWSSLMAGRPAPAIDPAPDRPCVMFYTSGTTGTPKGVPLSHANLMADLAGLLSAGIAGRGDRILLPLPLHHVYPFTVGMLASLAAGATLVFPAGIGAAEIATALREARVSALIGVPRLYTSLVEAVEAGIARQGGVSRTLAKMSLVISGALRRRAGWRAPGRLLFRALRSRVAPDLRILSSGGAPLEPSVALKLEALGWQVLTGYGLTETAPILTFNTPADTQIGSAGRPIAGVSLRIDAPAGEVEGEILARGPNVFRGYWNRPEATREAFTADGWFRTGDLGTIAADGTLWVIGRKSESIVLADGKKILPEEAEDAYGQSSLIREIAVLERNGVLVALIVPELEEVRKSGAESPESLIRGELESRARSLPSAQRLAGFAITRAALPRTAIGKLRRHLIEDLYRRALAGEVPRPSLAPSPEDRALIEAPPGREIWDWLQRRFSGRVLDFDTSPQLDLGVDSLGWIGLGMEIEQRYGIRLGEARIARIVTLRDLLNEAIDAAGDETPPAEPLAIPSRGRAMTMMAAVLHRLDRILMRVVFRLRIDGAHRLPRSGPLVIAANHSSYLDPLAIAAGLPHSLVRATYFAGWTGLMFRGPVSRLFSRIVNVLPVDPNRTALASLRLSRDVLSAGGILVWFPEGRRSPTGALQPLMPGLGALLESNDIPVVPVWIAGTFEAAPAGRLLPRFRPISLRIGAPVTPGELAARGRGADARERITDGLRLALLELARGVVRR
jgi:long-chain acyl-CoA synthetase